MSETHEIAGENEPTEDASTGCSAQALREQLRDVYRCIRRETPLVQRDERPFMQALDLRNAALNRYGDVPPLDATRVQLSDRAYINANDVCLNGAAYILCQAPMPSTTQTFWRMVWEKRCRVIVMLTPLQENGVAKADRYWPEPGASLVFGDLRVTRERGPLYISSQPQIRRLTLEHGSQKHAVALLQDTRWADFGCPQLKLVRPLLDTVRALQRELGAEDAPLVVHCSAGIGRSGTFAVLHALEGEAREGNINAARIESTVRALRQQRAGAVQTLDQFVFLHAALLHHT